MNYCAGIVRGWSCGQFLLRSKIIPCRC